MVSELLAEVANSLFFPAPTPLPVAWRHGGSPSLKPFSDLAVSRWEGERSQRRSSGPLTEARRLRRQRWPVPGGGLQTAASSISVDRGE